MSIQIVNDPFEGEVIKAVGDVKCKPYIAIVIGPSEKYRYQREFIGKYYNSSDGTVECLVKTSELDDGSLLDIRHKGKKGFYQYIQVGLKKLLEGDLRRLLAERLEREAKVVNFERR